MDGAVFAEPLIVGGRVIVATQNNSVYAFDAASGRRLWGVHLGTPVPGGSLPCGDVDPSGITSTPVANPDTSTVYLVAYLRGFVHVLVALDLTNGAVRWKRPVDPPGAAKTEQQRAALALAHGRVYVSYGGLFGDCGHYHGWVVGAPASGPTGSLYTYQVPSQNQGGIWAPAGPSVDSDGNLYVATGNGNSPSFDYGNAVIRLTSGLRMTSFFAPPDAGALNGADDDLGSTGPLLLPDGRAFIIGKSGVAYLLNVRHLGGLGGEVASLNLSPAWGGEAYAASVIYVPTLSGLVAVRVEPSGLARMWRQSAAALGSPIVAGPGVWVIGSGVLYQLDPATGEVRYRTSVGPAAHFATPAASGGRIFVAADGRVQTFG